MTHTLRARRRRPRDAAARLAVVFALTISLNVTATTVAREITPERMTPVVRAVRQARAAVVSIQGQKLVAASAEEAASGESPHQVNGMGTGTIVDERGYILTNYHVVSDVRHIHVTLDDGHERTAQLAAFDPTADLAIIKIPTDVPLNVIRIGTSADLMEGESVIALGNAFGYEQTVTRGIISALNRDVQVSDTQAYDDLIQTDASINPGNSGGPLLNIDGEMIGVNVAVRAGAQGIGFAIPVDNALRVAGQLLSIQRLQGKWHGVVGVADEDPTGPLHVTKVLPESPAASAGLRKGDEILRVGSTPVTRPLDLERALLDRATGEEVPVQLLRDGQNVTLELAVAEHHAVPSQPSTLDEAEVWNVLGMRLTQEPRSTFQRRNTRYRGGMRVDAVRSGSPAAEQGIEPGDILVGMHRWETASEQDLRYIISRPNLAELGKIKFYVLRGHDTLYGHLNVAATIEQGGPR
jgi:serine protease Do